VSITTEETMVVAAKVDTICQQELSNVYGFNYEDEDDDTL
jgi:hypothetical protein